MKNKWSISIIENTLMVLSFIQRLPLFIGYGIIGLISSGLYRITKNTDILKFAFKSSIKLYFRLNGIWISHKILDRITLESRIIIADNKSDMTPLILYSLLPIDKIIILPSPYFNEIPDNEKKMTWKQKLMIKLGFFPPESFTVLDYRHQTFTVEDFLKDAYSGAECVEFTDQKQIPFLLMIAIKLKLDVTVIRIQNADQIIFSSLLAPRKISIKILGNISKESSPEQVIKTYYKLIKNC